MEFKEIGRMIDDYFKIVVVGNTECGKTKFIERYVSGSYPEHSKTTIGVDFSKKTVQINDKNYLINIWDKSGQERFRTLPTMYYRNASGVIMVYDITCRDSFLALNSWLGEIQTHLPDKIPVILLAHKADLDRGRTVQESEGRDFSSANNIIFMEASAKTGLNVEEVFDRLIRMCSGQEVSTSKKIVYAKRLSKSPVSYHNPSHYYKNQPSEGNISLEIVSNNKKKQESKCCS